MSPYIALTLARRGDDPPGQDFVHDGGLASVMQRLAGSVECLAYCLSGGVIKNAARNKWKYGRHGTPQSGANATQFPIRLEPI
jgi:hypothetical protein